MNINWRVLWKKHIFEKVKILSSWTWRGSQTIIYFGEAGANNKKSWSKNLRRHFLQEDLASEKKSHSNILGAVETRENTMVSGSKAKCWSIEVCSIEYITLMVYLHTIPSHPNFANHFLELDSPTPKSPNNMIVLNIFFVWKNHVSGHLLQFVNDVAPVAVWSHNLWGGLSSPTKW